MLKNIIIIDETQPLKQIKRQFKNRTYWFLGLSWLVSFLLIWIIPQNIMQYDWAKSFVGFVGYVVPMVDGLEHIRLYGFTNTYNAHLGLSVLPYISFYLAILWVYASISIPYMFYIVKGNLIYNVDIKILMHRYKHKKLLYYFLIFIATIFLLAIYIVADLSTGYFKVKGVYYSSAGLSGGIFIMPVLLFFISCFYAHFLIKQQEKYHVK